MAGIYLCSRCVSIRYPGGRNAEISFQVSWSLKNFERITGKYSGLIGGLYPIQFQNKFLYGRGNFHQPCFIYDSQVVFWGVGNVL